jgi:(p)ppGpp synthase/HD superfamily hydrolase
VLLLKRALDQAAVWHSGQLRKYPSVSVPYVSHVAGVVAILARHGFDAEVQAAGALHDVLEDCGVTPEQLSEMFGPRVCELVRL